MSLYYEAAAAITNEKGAGGSLKSRIYANKSSKHSPAQIYALVSETTKWSAILKEVIEKSGILSAEKKLNDVLALLLVHDFLLSKKGIAAPQNHPLSVAISRHRARLSAEFTKLRVRQNFPTLEAFRKSIDESDAISYDATNANANASHPHPRWVRINMLSTSLDEQLKSTFQTFQQIDDLESILRAPRTKEVLFLDKNVENLIALPPQYDMSKVEAYRKGQLILQDKASCFPATLLDPGTAKGDIIDACSAPGNKTTHLAALASPGAPDVSGYNRVFAFERDKLRSETLRKMVSQAGANKLVTIFGCTDFLQVLPDDGRFKHTTAILLDPSCSGSGIVGRDEDPSIHLPALTKGQITQSQNSQNLRKRKRNLEKAVEYEDDHPTNTQVLQADEAGTSKRLEGLSAFQLKLLLHAMNFPAVNRIIYSTCSVHTIENEGVVVRALSSEEAQIRGWKLLPRDRQVAGMRAWSVRGCLTDCQRLLADQPRTADLPSPEQLAGACIRCEKGTLEGTSGFFVAGFTRVIANKAADGGQTIDESNEEEWNGFSDSD